MTDCSMADSLTVLDKVPILDDYDLVIKGFRLRKRDVVMGGLTFICLVVIIILAAILATKSGGHSGADESQKEACSTVGCLRSAAHIIELLNETASPCENFYKYACGNFANLHPLQYDQSEIDTRLLIKLENEEKILRVLDQEDKTTRSDSFERKLRVFYQSCKDHFRKAQGRGKSLLEKVIKPSGGWWALQNSSEWNASNWNFKQALLKAYRDFMVFIFFNLSPWNSLLEMFEIQIYPIYSDLERYLRNDSSEEDKKSTREFFRTVGSLLLRDAELNLTHDAMTSRVEIFTEDVYMVASTLADTISQGSHHTVNGSISLGKLYNDTQGVVNWLEIISSIFDKVQWTNESQVNVGDMIYLTSVMTFINQMDTRNKSRILNNYMVWCFAYNFINDLSLEYVIANHLFNLQITGTSVLPDPPKYCLLRVDNYMILAVNAIFVQQHFADQNKNKSHEITRYVQNALLERLDRLDHWMTSSTRQLASVKLQKSLIQLGYPDYMMDDEAMDSVFSSIIVERNDYFGNLMSFNTVQKANLHDFLTRQGRNVWFQPLIYPYATYYNQENALVVTAGYLQFPLYDYTLPHCVNFGTLGTIVGKELVHAIDEFGRNYNERSLLPGAWWSNETTARYMAMANCTEPLLHLFNRTYSTNTRRDVLAESSGIQVAFQAYKDWVKTNGAETIMTGGLLTSEQMFFVSYAQTNCNNQSPVQRGYWEFLGKEDTVNIALTQVPEFQQAFNCPDNSKMVAASRCKLY